MWRSSPHRVQSRPISVATPRATAGDDHNKMIVNYNKEQKSKIHTGDRVHAKDILQFSISAIHN